MAAGGAPDSEANCNAAQRKFWVGKQRNGELVKVESDEQGANLP